MYFDYAATTPPDSEVLKTFDAVNRDFWANPQALYLPGARAEQLLEESRKQVLSLLGAERDYRCIFSSGATESNNTLIKGMARQHKNRGTHVITSAVEHPSVLEVFRFLEQEGWELTVLPVTRSGLVEPEALRQALRPDTTLVSLMHVNNEIGSVNDIMALGTVVKESSRAVYHVDAAQSVGKLAIRLDRSPIDALSFSAHKFFGLKGSGALLLKNGLSLTPLLHGGGQEADLRSGTADAARAAALAKALRLALETSMDAYARAQAFKEIIAAALLAVPDTALNGVMEGSSPFIINVSVAGIRPETLLQGLAEKGIYISTVSACSARKTAESAVVYALTGNRERARTSIRISLSALTTKNEVDTLCSTAGPIIEALRMNRNTGN